MKHSILVTFIIPVYNEEKRIIACLETIAMQDFSHTQIEVLIPDGMSEDRTRKEIQKWSQNHDIYIKIIDNPRRVTEFGTALALKEAVGQYFVLLAADNHLVGSNWIRTAISAFQVFPDIFGVEARYLKIPRASLLNNYLTATLHISDPLARDMAIKPVLKEKVKSNNCVFYKYRIRPGYPTGANGFMYKVSAIKKFLQTDTFEEGQVALHFGLKGNAFFAQIEGHGIYHFFTKDFASYLKKRAKIALKHQTRIQERKTWVHYTGKRMYLFAFLNVTLVYPILFSIVELVKTGDILWLLHAPIAFITTIIYGWNWLKIKLTGKKAW